jgi:hypothetical protein
MPEEKNKEEKKKQDMYKLVEIPTQHTLAIQSSDGETFAIDQAIVLLLNKIDEIKSVIG